MSLAGKGKSKTRQKQKQNNNNNSNDNNKTGQTNSSNNNNNKKRHPSRLPCEVHCVDHRWLVFVRSLTTLPRLLSMLNFEDKLTACGGLYDSTTAVINPSWRFRVHPSPLWTSICRKPETCLVVCLSPCLHQWEWDNVHNSYHVWGTPEGRDTSKCRSWRVNQLVFALTRELYTF